MKLITKVKIENVELNEELNSILDQYAKDQLVETFKENIDDFLKKDIIITHSHDTVILYHVDIKGEEVCK